MTVLLTPEWGGGPAAPDVVDALWRAMTVARNAGGREVRPLDVVAAVVEPTGPHADRVSRWLSAAGVDPAGVAAIAGDASVRDDAEPSIDPGLTVPGPLRPSAELRERLGELDRWCALSFDRQASVAHLLAAVLDGDDPDLAPLRDGGLDADTILRCAAEGGDADCFSMTAVPSSLVVPDLTAPVDYERRGITTRPPRRLSGVNSAMYASTIPTGDRINTPLSAARADLMVLFIAARGLVFPTALIMLARETLGGGGLWVLPLVVFLVPSPQVVPVWVWLLSRAVFVTLAPLPVALLGIAEVVLRTCELHFALWLKRVDLGRADYALKDLRNQVQSDLPELFEETAAGGQRMIDSFKGGGR